MQRRGVGGAPQRRRARDRPRKRTAPSPTASQARGPPPRRLGLRDDARESSGASARAGDELVRHAPRRRARRRPRTPRRGARRSPPAPRSAARPGALGASRRRAPLRRAPRRLETPTSSTDSDCASPRAVATPTRRPGERARARPRPRSGRARSRRRRRRASSSSRHRQQPRRVPGVLAAGGIVARLRASPVGQAQRHRRRGRGGVEAEHDHVAPPSSRVARALAHARCAGGRRRDG